MKWSMSFSNSLPRISNERSFETMEKFTESKLYSFLEKEESKVWQYSSTMLAELFEDERAGHLVFPEV